MLDREKFFTLHIHKSYHIHRLINEIFGTTTGGQSALATHFHQVSLGSFLFDERQCFFLIYSNARNAKSSRRCIEFDIYCDSSNKVNEN